MLLTSPVPRRKLSCSVCCRPFNKGEELTSLLREAEEEGKYLREDLCSSCWQEHSQQQKNDSLLSTWRTRIPDDANANKKEMAEAVKERALHLLCAYLEDQQKASFAYLLALYLERRKQLLRVRRAKESCDQKRLLFEIKSSGEMIEVPRFDVISERERLQEELLRALSGQEESIG